MTGRQKAFAWIAIVVGFCLLVMAQAAANSDSAFWLRTPVFVIITLAGLTLVFGGGMFLWQRHQ